MGCPFLTKTFFSFKIGPTSHLDLIVSREAKKHSFIRMDIDEKRYLELLIVYVAPESSQRNQG